MSERTQVEVLLPLDHPPDALEQRTLRKIAFAEARRLVAPGRVLGIVSLARCIHQDTGGLAIKVRFAVEVPEALQPHRTSHAVN